MNKEKQLIDKLSKTTDNAIQETDEMMELLKSGGADKAFWDKFEKNKETSKDMKKAIDELGKIYKEVE